MKDIRRKLGNELEDVIAECFKKIDPYAKRKKNSTITDVDNKFCRVECKRRNSKDFTIKQKVWDKICASVPRNSNKFPIYVNQNIIGEILIVLSKDDFFRLMYEAKKESI